MAYFPADLLKCVAFLGYKDQHGVYRFAGSAFWVSRAGPDDIKTDYRPAYLVTVAHVVEKIRRDGTDNRVWVRVNTSAGNQDWQETSITCWRTHTDPAVDIAVLKMGVGSEYDHITWPLESSVLNDNLDTDQTGDRRIELGDEICFAGLFHPHAGARRNLPIVRVGTIAALREELVANREGLPMDVYLVESRSIGGLSGSPVFIDIRTAKTTRPPSWGYMAGAYDSSPMSFKLLGLVHGHFGDDILPDATSDDGKEKIHINMGIAMVIPAEKIAEVLAGYMSEEAIEADDVRKRKQTRASFQTGDVSGQQPNVTFGTMPLPNPESKKD